MLIAPGIRDIVMCVSNKAVRNHKHRRRCTVTLSLDKARFHNTKVFAPWVDAFVWIGMILQVQTVLTLIASMNIAAIDVSSMPKCPTQDTRPFLPKQKETSRTPPYFKELLSILTMLLTLYCSLA